MTMPARKQEEDVNSDPLMKQANSMGERELQDILSPAAQQDSRYRDTQSQQHYKFTCISTTQDLQHRYTQ